MAPARIRPDEEKAALARGWLDERRRFGTTQEDYARRHGVRPRTLRSYVAQLAPEAVPSIRQLRVILAEALETLGRLAARMEALDAEAAAVSGLAVSARPSPAQMPPAAATADPLGTTAVAIPHSSEHAAGQAPGSDVGIATQELTSIKSSFWD